MKIYVILMKKDDNGPIRQYRTESNTAVLEVYQGNTVANPAVLELYQGI